MYEYHRNYVPPSHLPIKPSTPRGSLRSSRELFASRTREAYFRSRSSTRPLSLRTLWRPSKVARRWVPNGYLSRFWTLFLLATNGCTSLLSQWCMCVLSPGGLALDSSSHSNLLRFLNCGSQPIADLRYLLMMSLHFL